MKRLFLPIRFFFFTFFITFSALGQTPVDSLKQVLQQAESVDDKLETLKKLYQQLERSEPEKAIQYARQALSLGQDKPGAQADALTLLGVVYDTRGKYDSAIMFYQKAQQLAKKHDFPNVLADTYHNIGLIEKNRSNYTAAIENYQKALSIYQEKHNQRGVATSTANIALIYELKGDQQTAIKEYKKVLAAFRSIENKKSEYWTLNRIGGIYYNLGDYAQAVAYMDSSRVMAQELGDKAAVAWRYNNIANVHQTWGNYEKAMDYFEEARLLAEEVDNQGLVSTVLNNQAGLLLKQEKITEAEARIQRALSINEKLGDKTSIAWSYQLMGQLHMKQGKYAQARTEFERALNGNLELGNQLYVAENYTELGEVYLATKNFPEAIEKSRKALDLAQKLGVKEQIRRSANTLAQAYAKTQDYQRAYQYHVLFKQTNDSIFSEESQKRIRTIEARFELERKENQIQLQNTQLAQKDAELREEKIRQQALLLGILALGLIVGLTVVGYLRIRRARNKIEVQNQVILEKNDRLSQQKNEIEQQSEQLLKANREISKSNMALKQQAEEIQVQADALQESNQKLMELDRFKQDMTSMIAHDLKNPLNTIINAEETTPDSWQRSKQAGRQMLHLVSNMLDVHKYQETEIQTNPENVPLDRLTEKVCADVDFLVTQKSIQLQTEIPEGTSAYADPELLTRILTNLLTNAIKYTPLNGTIRLQAERLPDTDQLKISVTDNGAGIPKELLPRIFSRFGQVDARDSGRIQSTGLGLTFCKLAVEAQGGEIGVDSEVGMGSQFWFTLKGGITQSAAVRDEAEAQTAAGYTLSEADKALLRPYAEELKNCSVYEVSQVMKILESIDYPTENENIQAWVKDVDTCTFNLNEDRYRKILAFLD